MTSALAAEIVFSNAENLYHVVGSCVLALMAVMFVALAIVALRQDDHVVESLTSPKYRCAAGRRVEG